MNIQLASGRGCYVTDTHGKKYLDLYGGHGVISIGHSHPYYVQKITEQLNSIGFYSNSVRIAQQEELAFKLGELSGYPDYELFLCNSGAEANENALKLASFQNGRKKIISFTKSFHGRTSLAVEATDDKNLRAAVNSNGNVVFLSFNDEEALKNAMDETTCAVIIEGIQGVGGVNVPEPTFMKLIGKLCEKYGAYFICDEIQSGYGRSGKFFAHQYAGIKPDLITVAKGMGNGFPVAGVLISEKFTSKHGMLGTTFGGNYLACAAAIAVLDVMKDELLIENAAQTGDALISKLRENNKVGPVRGKGLMIGFDPAGDATQLRKLLVAKGILTGSSGKTTIRLLPPLTVNREELHEFTEILSEVITTKHTIEA